MYETVKPLYLQLYTRVRKVLRDKFGTAAVPSKGPVPVHLLGKFPNGLLFDIIDRIKNKIIILSFSIVILWVPRHMNGIAFIIHYCSHNILEFKKKKRAQNTG